MSFHKTQYLELSSKVTRQLCLELLTWSREREEQGETVAGESHLNTVFLSHLCPHRAERSDSLLVLQESACNAGDLGSIPGLGRAPEGGMEVWQGASETGQEAVDRRPQRSGVGRGEYGTPKRAEPGGPVPR